MYLGPTKRELQTVQKVYQVAFLSTAMGAGQSCIRMVEALVVPGKSSCPVLAARNIAKAVRGSWSSAGLFCRGKTYVPKWGDEVVGYFLCPALCSCYRVRAAGTISLQVARAKLFPSSLLDCSYDSDTCGQVIRGDDTVSGLVS